MACFTIRASLKPGRGGFEILARKDASNLLPTMQLPLDRINRWQGQYLEKYDSLSVTAILKLLRKACMASNPSEDERNFAKALSVSLEALKNEISDPFFNDATLIARPVEAPCRGSTKDSPPGTALLIVFKIIVPLQSRAPGKKLDFVPVQYFKMQQYTYRNSVDHAALARKTYREFAPVLGLDDCLGIGSARTPQIAGLDRTYAMAEAQDTGDRRTFVDELFAIVIATRK